MANGEDTNNTRAFRALTVQALQREMDSPLLHRIQTLENEVESLKRRMDEVEHNGAATAQKWLDLPTMAKMKGIQYGTLQGDKYRQPPRCYAKKHGRFWKYPRDIVDRWMDMSTKEVRAWHFATDLPQTSDTTIVEHSGA